MGMSLKEKRATSFVYMILLIGVMVLFGRYAAQEEGDTAGEYVSQIGQLIDTLGRDTCDAQFQEASQKSVEQGSDSLAFWWWFRKSDSECRGCRWRA